MYQKLLVPVDNSSQSDAAMHLAIAIAKAGGAEVTGNHVFAARLHEGRFRQMEAGLPDRYQTEQTLDYQRGVHKSLIGDGLQLVSDSYLNGFESLCQSSDVAFRRNTAEGRNYEEILKEAQRGDYNLVALGAQGLGRIERSLVGSVCERVASLVRQDVLVARKMAPLANARILVAVDGSPDSHKAMTRGAFFAKAFGARLSAVAVYDPNFHVAAFRGIAGVLPTEAAQAFRFEEQEKLHDEIINAGLQKVYETELQRAVALASAEGVAVEAAVLEGKPYDEILKRAEEGNFHLIIAGRYGIHRAADTNMGSHTTNLLRFATCNLLIVHDRQADSKEIAADAGTQGADQIVWSEAAEKRLQRIPWFARPMAKRSIENTAREQGRTEVTEEMFDAIRKNFGM